MEKIAEKLLLLLEISLLCGFFAHAANASGIVKSNENSFANDPSDKAVISSGFAGVPPIIIDPNVLRFGDGLHLFYSTYFCQLQDGSYYYSWDPKNNAHCSIDESITAIGYAFSKDEGYTWSYRGSPVFAPGGGEWEQYKVETSFVHNNGSHLLLFYSAIGYVNGTLLDNRYQIGLSLLNLNGRLVSDALLDGSEQFYRPYSNPLIPMETAVSSFHNNVQEPSVVFKDDHYELYYLGLKFLRPAVSPDAPGQKIQLIGVGCAVFDTSFNMISNSADPFPNTSWQINMPEVHYIKSKELYVMVSASMNNNQLHKEELVQFSYSSNPQESWTSPEPVVTPPGGQEYNGWATTTPSIVADANDQFLLFYSAFGANYTDNNGVCDYSSRFGIGVPDPACVYLTLGRAKQQQLI